MDRYKDHAGTVSGLLHDTDMIPGWLDELIEAVLSKTDSYNDLIGTISDSTFAASAVPVAGVPTSNLSVFYVEDEPTRSAKLKSAKELLAGFQGAVKRCQTLAANGVEMIPDPMKPGATISAVTACQNELDAKLTDEKVGAVKLTRKYK